MADPQNTLGDLLGRFGISLGDGESRRQDLIRRLKTVKDPIERDEIIWALSGQKRHEIAYRPSPGAPPTGVFGKQPAAEKRPAPISTSSTSQSSPEMSPGARRGTASGPPQLRVANILNYVVPILFAFFGITNIVRAIEAFRAGAEKEEVLVQAIMGIGFIVFALAGFFSGRMKKALEKAKGI